MNSRIVQNHTAAHEQQKFKHVDFLSYVIQDTSNSNLFDFFLPNGPKVMIHFFITHTLYLQNNQQGN